MVDSKPEDSEPQTGSPWQIKRGDVFWANFPALGGSIARGRRPGVVVQNNVGNRFSQTVIVSPITSSSSKKQYPVNVAIPEGILPKPSEIRANQIITIRKDLLEKWIAHLPDDVMAKVDEALCVSLGLPREFPRFE